MISLVRSFIESTMLATSNSLALSIVVKATLILAMALVSVVLARRSRSSMRHAILAAALGLLLVLPVASALAPPFRVAMPAAAPEEIAPIPLMPLKRFVPSVEAPRVAADAGKPGGTSFPLPTVLLSVWLAGTGLFLLPAIVGLWQVRSLRRFGLPWVQGQAAADGLAPEAGLERRIEVLLHESLPGPMTCGVLHPAIVFPADAAEWQEGDLNRALVHELEHVKRGDWILLCLARTVCAVYWFHPLVWIAWRRLGVEAERACDDAVLGRSEATAYADQLIQLARRMSASRKSPVLAMANRSDLSTRIGALLDQRQRRGRVGASLLALACVAVVLGAAISPLQMVAAPQGESSATVRKGPRFEVASVRMEDPHDPHSSPAYTNNPSFNSRTTVFPSNRLMMRHTLLRSLICESYAVDCGYILGEPDWSFQQHYDLDAKLEGNTLLTFEQMKPALQSLLEDRFHLRWHCSPKLVPGYALVVAKGGAKLQPNKGAPIGGMFGGPIFKYQNATLEQFALALRSPLNNQPVVDKTGIKGTYDFDLKYGPHDPDDPRFAALIESLHLENLPDIFTVLEQQLGLKLVPEKITINTLVIDHVDRIPSEN
ncbi:MAG TPA: M56 family metallopeptidase [Bryobacteraceae bacterium]|jgi:uncharacterized protein (TIGR03435 family)